MCVNQRVAASEVHFLDIHLTDSYSQLYGPSCIKPNHHYATHVAECTRRFGPLRDFWSFLFERLNKVLKAYNVNNHGDGVLETTFFVEFHRTSSIAHVVRPSVFVFTAPSALITLSLGELHGSRPTKSSSCPATGSDHAQGYAR